MKEIEERLLEVLTNEPKSAREIMDLTGIPSKSDLRRHINSLRLQGHLICSRTNDGGGYWLGNQQDRERTIASLQSRKLELIKVIQALKRGPIDGQEVMDEVR